MGLKTSILLSALVLGCAAIGGFISERAVSSTGKIQTSSRTVAADYSEALGIIRDNYAGGVDHEALTESSVQGMLWSLDPHSAFFTASEFRTLFEEQASQFYGIGVSIMQYPDGVYVQSVIPGTPAEEAGLRYGDRFLKIDGDDATEWTSAEVSKNVRGERGSQVKLEIERPDSAQPISFEIVRGGVPLPSVRNVFMLSEDVGYIGLTGGFQETTSAEFDEAVFELQSRGMKNLVLDLRNNPGGLLKQAREIVSRFIEPGKTVVTVKGRASYSRTEKLETSGDPIADLPVVVLMNGGSASASEIVAGAMQDHARGIVLGEDSFGKGLVQRVFPLPFGTGITLTTARYYTPYGRSLQKDYSNGSIYEYYSHSSEEGESEEPVPKPKGVPVTTAKGRIFYGGRGIEPDVLVKPTEFNPKRLKINQAAFYFVRKLAYGKVKGMESFRIGKQRFLKEVSTSVIRVDEPLYNAFTEFVKSDRRLGLTIEMLGADEEYARMQLREEMATALYSNEIGQQVLLENDPQVRRALESVKDAISLIGKK
jgi:carboxyl-terminal processing protease